MERWRIKSEQCQCVISRPRTLLKFHGVKVLETFAPEERKFHGCESSKERKFLDFSLLGSECSTERKFSLWTFRSRERKCSGTKSRDAIFGRRLLSIYHYQFSICIPADCRSTAITNLIHSLITLTYRRCY